MPNCASSKKQLVATRNKTTKLISRMKKTAATMEPVLRQFGDQVLCLKHNLNSQAIAGIRGEAAKVEADVSELIKSMEASIAESEAFIKEME